jgi:hypothetical protein
MNRLHTFGKVVAWTALQFMFFVVAYEIVRFSVLTYRGYIRRDFAYGIGLHYGVYLLILLALINSVVQVLSSRMKVRVFVAVACVGLWAAYWLPSASSIPYRAALVLTLGGISLLIPVLFSRAPIQVRGVYKIGGAT